jgi:AMP-polyphosphate phosphotransferase
MILRASLPRDRRRRRGAERTGGPGCYACLPVLKELDLGRALTRERYKEQFPPLQDRLRQLQYDLLAAEIPTVAVFEGWDASGKGTVIQRLSEKLDPRAFRAWPGAPPSELEQRYHFLWRYQTKLPEDGHVVVFDRSWYGRVLVERVEKLVKKRVWRPAYDEINQFERWLVDDGQVLVKFFLHISRKEQRGRLVAMREDENQRWKVEREDWRRNRQYDRWHRATEEMLERTHSEWAPWTVVEATDARWTRVKVFRTLVERMEAALQRRQATPAAVSRTRAAETATRSDRERHGRESLRLAAVEAGGAGLPLEED